MVKWLAFIVKKTVAVAKENCVETLTIKQMEVALKSIYPPHFAQYHQPRIFFMNINLFFLSATNKTITKAPSV